MNPANKIKKNRWPVAIAISSAVTLILFQNCSSVKIDTANPALTVDSGQNSSLQDINDNPSQMPESKN